MKKGFFKISGVGVRPIGKNGMVVRVRFENGDVVTLTGKQVRHIHSFAKTEKRKSHRAGMGFHKYGFVPRLTVPGATIKMH